MSSQLYQSACLAELAALKPGNVHAMADGHGMTVEQFVKSAELSVPYRDWETDRKSVVEGKRVG